jgi:hypothetical protein
VILGIANHAGGTVLLHDTHAWSVNAVPKILRWLDETNTERRAQGRPVYDILDAPQYLEGARARLPMIRAAEQAARPRTRDAGAPVDASLVEPTTGPVTQVTDAGVTQGAPSDAGAPPDDR